MQKQGRKVDKVTCGILAAFILMGGTHLTCRYDIGAMVDDLFQKVSAETVLPDAPVPEPVAAAPAGMPQAIVDSNEPIEQPTIARNPFLVPAAAKPAPAQPVISVPVNQPGAPNPAVNAGNAPRMSAPAAPVVEARPIVRGIVQSNGRSMAIIEYKGSSNTYSVGQTIDGDYSVDSINAHSVSIDGRSVAIGGKG